MACTNTNPCDQTSVTTSASGKKISQLPTTYQLSANDLFVVVDVHADGPNTADVTKNVEYETVIYYDNTGTTLTADTFQDAISELDETIAGLSGVTDAPDNDTYLRTDGAWIQSDQFDTSKYYQNVEVDALLTEYATSANLQAHIIDFNNPHQVDKNDVGLSAVDNTSDLDKPISTATQSALDDKADASDLTAHVTSATIHFPDVTTSATYLRTDGAWIPSDPFDEDLYYLITEVDSLLDAKLDVVLSAAPEGIASLDASGKVPLAQLPSIITSAGDMEKAVYDTNDSGVVDNSERLGGELPGYYATSASVVPLFGDTASRPSGAATGLMYFNTDLGYPIWFNGSNWVNATGAFIVGPA